MNGARGEGILSFRRNRVRTTTRINPATAYVLKNIRTQWKQYCIMLMYDGESELILKF